MGTLLGIVGLVIVVMAILGALGSGAPAAPPSRRAAPRTSAPRPATTSTAIARQREIERQRRADEAFVDGVLFSHYFLDDAEEHTSSWADDDGDFDD